MFGTWIGWIVKTFDYINRVTKRFRFRSTRVRGHTLPLVAMLLLDRSCVIVGKFFEILRSPTYDVPIDYEMHEEFFINLNVYLPSLLFFAGKFLRALLR